MKPFAPRPIATSIALALFASSPAYAAVSLSDVPLFAVEGVPPNFSVTLDDSGSMAWAYVPDGISGTRNTRRGRSADYNPQYYNPNTVYKAPPGIPDANGVSTPLTTSFTAAYKNGFRTASGRARDELDAYSGARLSDSPFDYNGDGVINASDFIVITGPSGSTPADAGSGIRIKGDVGMVFLNETSIVDAETDDKKIISTASGGIESMTESKSASLNRTWRELGN